jgi:hypothetical protein
MRKLSFFTVFIALIISLAFYGCSKSSTTSSTSITNATSSEWVLSGTTYKGAITGYNDTTSTFLAILNSTDISGNSITITFYSHPAANGTYAVSDAAGSNDCSIAAETYKSGVSTIYDSGITAGDSVNVTISGGKLTAKFTNVTVGVGATATTVSGTVIQQ